MEHETLFTASKWDILKQLETGPSSPLELSKACKTSIANISQQLRLLEMAGLVKSERISNRDKGKPRVLYSLSGNLSYLIATSGNFVDKRILQLSNYNKLTMRIWFYPQKDMHYTLEKAFWQIEKHFDKLSFLGIDMTRELPVTFIVKFKGKQHEINPFTVTDPEGVKRQVVFSTDLPPAESMYILYDPKGITNNSGDER